MKVELRQATEADYELMLKWRNDPEISKWFYSQQQGKIITWDEHLAWLKSRNKDFLIYIMFAGEDENNLQRVGVITASNIDDLEAEIGGYVGEKSFWGKWVGPAATRQLLDILRSKGKQYARVAILDVNRRSIVMCKRLGFVRVGDALPGESLYRKKL